MKIGPYSLENNLFLAPMAGVTDLPFRKLCKNLGAGVVVSEMVTSDPSLQNSRKTKLRLAHEFKSDDLPFMKEPGLRVVQIAGGDAEMMSAAARNNVSLGAQVIDINMGCPAKKVCRKAAGSALLKDPSLVEEILKAVVTEVEVPVTLKIRTGWDQENKNALLIAKIAEDCGIQSLAIHGRTRACKYAGIAEHDTTALVKQSVKIPVVANGDITDPMAAKKVLEYTGVDGLMIGRAAQGRPWIFKEIDYFLKNNQLMPKLKTSEIKQILLNHLKALHQFYGEIQGVRIARKHVSWYLTDHEASDEVEVKLFKNGFNKILSGEEQLNAITQFLKN